MAASCVMTRLMGSTLLVVEPADLMTIPVVLSIVILVAGTIPAYRASRLVALPYE